MTEIWKDIKGFEGCYQVSNLGRIKSLPREIYNGKGHYTSTEKILSGHMITNGYLQVELKKDNKRNLKLIHCLVAEAFIPNLDNKPQVNHKNGNKTKNNVDNLEWCTNSENQIHAYYMGLSKHSEIAGKPKKAVYQIDLKTNVIINTYSSIAEAGRLTNTRSSNISLVCNGSRNSAGGYKWEYVKEMESDVYEGNKFF